MNESWPRIAVMGGGAVGCYFGGMLARAGAPVTLIGRAQHVEAITQRGLRLESIRFQQHILLSATTDVAAARDAELVLFSVKTLDTEAAARLLAPHLSPSAVVLSMQNGVENVPRLRAHMHCQILAAVVYVAAEMTGPGCVKHTGRGDLVIGVLREPAGHADPTRQQLEDIAALMGRAGIPCRESENLEGELWTKLLMNCAYNAISALGCTRYGRIIADPLSRAVLQEAVREVLAVAQASGVRMPVGDLVEAACQLADAMPEATSSTAQDIARRKRTEIGDLNGFIVRRGEALGVPTPVNRTLHALVTLLEQAEASATS